MISNGKNAFVILLSSVLAISLFSCATTQMETWMDKNYRGGPLKKIVVFAIFKKGEKRSSFEKSMVKQLKKEGIQAVASADIMPKVRITGDRDKEIDRITHQANADGILIFKVKSIKRDTRYIPGDPHYYFSYYWNYLDEIQQRDEENRIASISVDIRLYSNKTDRLIWSADSETFSPDSVEAGASSIGRKLATILRDKGFVARK